jgi:ABC-2 type transport system permease protein
MASDSPIVSGISAVTMNWSSPISVDEGKNSGREVSVLLRSTARSWTQEDTNVQPDFDLYPDLGFPVSTERQPHRLAVSIQGAFESAFKGQPPPVDSGEEEELAPSAEITTTEEALPATIDVSPETARLVVFGSAEFLNDLVFEISSRLGPERYLNSLKLVQNAVAWCIEDLDLLDIRARGTSARVLVPLTEQQQTLWEVANYVVALLGLGTIGAVMNVRRRNQRPLELVPAEETDAPEVEGGQG